MTVSSYQVELLVKRFRRWLDWAAGPLPPKPDAEDAIDVSDGARRLAQQGPSVAPRPGSGPVVTDPQQIADRRQWPPAVEAELERRAGTFLTPPWPDPPVNKPIPRLRKRTTA